MQEPLSLKTNINQSLEIAALHLLRKSFEEDNCYLDADFSLDELQQRLGLSKDRLVALIYNCYGQSFSEVCRTHRIKCLKELILKYGNQISLAEYAKLSGFMDVPQMQSSLKESLVMDFDEFKRYVNMQTYRKENNNL